MNFEIVAKIRQNFGQMKLGAVYWGFTVFPVKSSTLLVFQTPRYCIPLCS
jgi:hypothetical protein